MRVTPQPRPWAARYAREVFPGALLAGVIAFSSLAIGTTHARALEGGRIGPECGSYYTVAPGDTLSKIAGRVYGDVLKYDRLLRANAELLKGSIEIEVGQRLLIPCAEEAQLPRHADTTAGAPRRAKPAGVAMSAPPSDNPDDPVSTVAPPGRGCGIFHRVARGEILGNISMMRYGTSRNYLRIFEANRDILETPESLEVGDLLYIPCLDGSTPQTRQEALAALSNRSAAVPALNDTPDGPTTEDVATKEVAREADVSPTGPRGSGPGEAQRSAPAAPTTKPGPGAPASADSAGPATAETERADGPALSAALVRPVAAPLTLVTRSNAAPFVHLALPEGGAVVELVRRSLARAAPDREISIHFAETAQRQIELLAEGRDLVGFPWPRPDCTRADALPPDLHRLCTDFAFSAPLLETRMAFYVRAGDPLSAATRPAALRGMRICRPAGWFTFDLEIAGLVEPLVEYVAGRDPLDCFLSLEVGRVDVVTMDASSARRAIARLGIVDRVSEVQDLAAAFTLHAVAPRANPRALETLAAIDEGLAELKRSGSWFEILSHHLSTFRLSMR